MRQKTLRVIGPGSMGCIAVVKFDTTLTGITLPASAVREEAS